MTLSFNLAPGAALGDAVDAIDQRIGSHAVCRAPLRAPSRAPRRPSRARCKTQPLLILAALVAVYIILGMLYESYIHPLTILSTLPSAGVGALLVLLLFHFDLSVMALIGIILLIGIVKKNGIMMVDFAIQAEREQHLSPDDAIRQACLLRFRPIMMTTMAALLGALPLVLGHGTGSELRQPLGLHHGRRPHREPGADAVHDAGGVPLPRPSCACGCGGRRHSRIAARGRAIAPGAAGAEPP